MSSANLMALRYVPEVTPGVTPASPTLTALRFLSESLNFNITNTQSEEIRSDRAETDLIQTAADSAGDINFELSFSSFDAFLEAALGGTWTSVSGNISRVQNGVLTRFFTIQKHFTDITTPTSIFHNFRGCAVNTFNLSFELGRIVTGSMGLMAFSMTPATAQFAGATTPAAPTTKPMNAVVDFNNFAIDAVPYSGCINSLTMAINNNLRAIKCIGSIFSTDMIPGTFELTGNMNLYFRDGSMYDRFVTGTEFAITFRLTDQAGNLYIFEMPRCKFETGEVVAGGRNTDIMFNATYRALYDGTAGYVIRVTRDPVG